MFRVSFYIAICGSRFEKSQVSERSQYQKAHLVKTDSAREVVAVPNIAKLTT